MKYLAVFALMFSGCVGHVREVTHEPLSKTGIVEYDVVLTADVHERYAEVRDVIAGRCGPAYQIVRNEKGLIESGTSSQYANYVYHKNFFVYRCMDIK